MPLCLQNACYSLECGSVAEQWPRRFEALDSYPYISPKMKKERKERSGDGGRKGVGRREELIYGENIKIGKGRRSCFNI